MTDELREIRDKIDRACRVGHMLAATLAVHLPPGHDMREEHTGRRLAQIEDEVDEVIRLRARERELMAAQAEEPATALCESITHGCEAQDTLAKVRAIVDRWMLDDGSNGSCGDCMNDIAELFPNRVKP